MISIITINRNNKEGLDNTIKSVLNQSEIIFEYIIIDGASIDGSQDIINKYDSKITKWISEPDKGIYDAMNKGINISNGKYLLFLNSGDILYNNNVIKNIKNKISDSDIITGGLEMFSKNGNSEIILPHQNVDFNTFATSFISHPSSFIKKELFIKYGLYDISYKIAADHKAFFLFFSNLKIKYQPINDIITIHEKGGISSNMNFNLIHDFERSRVLNEIPIFYKPLFFSKKTLKFNLIKKLYFKVFILIKSLFE
jgi:glycosyltransferase involved in cell wall biosynthesis